MTNPPLSWNLHHAYTRLAELNLAMANKEKDCLQRAFYMDLARMYAKKVGRAVERTKR